MVTKKKTELKTIIGSSGSSIPIPKMFNKNEHDRLVWREGILKYKGFDIKMTPRNPEIMPIYVKTRGDMEKIISQFPRVIFNLGRLK